MRISNACFDAILDVYLNQFTSGEPDFMVWMQTKGFSFEETDQVLAYAEEIGVI